MQGPPLSLDPDRYIPPQITETFGETQFTDCLWCSGFGLVDIWTTGAVTRDRNWRPLNQVRLKARREEFRDASNDQVGGSNLDDLARGVKVFWPDLPKLLNTDDGSASDTWDTLWPKLQGHYSIVLIGNPKGINNPNSFLRTAQGNDDYDHAILLVRALTDKALIMDPLRPPSSKPRWVPKAEVRQFASKFTNAGVPGHAIVLRGKESALGQANIKIARLEAQLAGKPVDCADAIASARNQALDEAESAVAALPRA